MRYPHVKIVDSVGPPVYKYAYCYGSLEPARSGVYAGVINRANGRWSFHPVPACDILLDAEDIANLHNVTDECVALLNVTARLLK